MSLFAVTLLEPVGLIQRWQEVEGLGHALRARAGPGPLGGAEHTEVFWVLCSLYKAPK